MKAKEGIGGVVAASLAARVVFVFALDLRDGGRSLHRANGEPGRMQVQWPMVHNRRGRRVDGRGHHRPGTWTWRAICAEPDR